MGAINVTFRTLPSARLTDSVDSRRPKGRSPSFHRLGWE